MDVLFQRTRDIDDFELKSHWARYLCILASGFLEVAVSALYSQYAHQVSAPGVANFVEATLENFHSPKMMNICLVARQFNPDWADQLESATAGELKDAVDSIVANRHLIAHGRDVSISYVRI